MRSLIMKQINNNISGIYCVIDRFLFRIIYQNQGRNRQSIHAMKREINSLFHLSHFPTLISVQSRNEF